LSEGAKVDNESKRKGLAMKRTVFRVALGMAVLFGAHGVQATQSVIPAALADGTQFSGTSPTWSVSRGGGQQLVFFGGYTSTNPNEAGLGLNIQYDPTKIASVVIDQVLTKCMVFVPEVVRSTDLIPVELGQVKFGWADTSQRAGGAVGWPGTADPPLTPPPPAVPTTAPCMNPQGIVTTTAAFTPPTTLFRFTATLNPSFTSGTSNIVLSSSSMSCASCTPAGPVPSPILNTLVVTGLVAPLCNLDVTGDGSLQGLSDGVLIARIMLGISDSFLFNNIIVTGPNNTPALVRSAYAGNDYDADNSGAQQGLVDGIILARLMLGITDANLLNNLAMPAGAPTAAAIRANVNAKCGTSF
jgi:hypothetical protein